MPRNRLKRRGAGKTICLMLLCAFILSDLGLFGCDRKEAGAGAALSTVHKVDAPSAIIELARQKIDDTITAYSSGRYLTDDDGELAKIKILDSRITNLQFAKRIDVYDRLVGQRVIDGIQSAYEDFYFFSYNLFPDKEDLEGKSLSFDLDDEGWISFEKTTPYDSDSAPGELLLIAGYTDDEIIRSEVVRTADFSDEWCENYINGLFPDYNAMLTENAFRVIDEYSFIFTNSGDFLPVSLCGKQYALPTDINEISKKPQYTDYFADYLTEITYGGSRYRAPSDFLIETLNYNMPSADDALEVVVYMCTDVWREPTTYRGVAVGFSEKELLRLYPDDLYYLDKDEASGSNEIYLRNKDFDRAYFYRPNDQTANDITFYIKDGEISFIEMTAAYERRYAYGGAADFENLVNKPTDEKSEFTVETAAEFYKELELLEDTEDAFTARISIKIPVVSESTAHADAINSTTYSDYYIDMIDQFKTGDFSVLYPGPERYAEYSIDYEVHTWNGAAALMINSTYFLENAGGGWNRTVWYYDCDTGNVMSARQYARKCGVDEAAIIKQYNDNSAFDCINSVYEANFYIDETGDIVTFENAAV
ncbi:MAG: hypothetical protein LBK57_09475 [Clostridiales Family XIII bacterium]|jgi:hypothetical protein|nr:hypothetical protein [Clostridiales Family XIII bacterium]